MTGTAWLILGCVSYSAVIVMTFYFFLALPARRRAEVEIAEIRSRPESTGTADPEIAALLGRADTELQSKVSLTFGKVAAGLRLIRYASRRLVEMHDSASLREFSIQLRGTNLMISDETALEFVTQLRQFDKREVEVLELEFGLQRRTTWLSLVGLLLVGAIALTVSGHAINIALGALGGFAAVVRPFIIRRPGDRDYSTSWNVIILSPVAGALAAIPGLLLVALLASNGIGILGEQFANVWSDSTSPTALGISVLVGLIGGLIGSLAQSASTFLAPPPSPTSEQ